MAGQILCVIGARGGSQGVPRKNVDPVAGKPLIGWTVERAKAVHRLTDVVLSTDDDEIARVGQSFGARVPFKRPPELATSEAGKFAVWKHALAESERVYSKSYDWFLDMDCTNPLLKPDDVESMLDTFRDWPDYETIDGMITVCSPHRNPYFNQVEETRGGLALCKILDRRVEGRQFAPRVWDIVAGLYLFKAEFIRQASYMLEGRLMPFEVPREKSFDIDEPLDRRIVEFLLSEHRNAPI